MLNFRVFSLLCTVENVYYVSISGCVQQMQMANHFSSIFSHSLANIIVGDVRLSVLLFVSREKGL